MIDRSSLNGEVLSRFSRLIKSGRMAHAYLFAGPKGIGKSETAFSVAKLVNCEKRIAGESSHSCDQCSSCIKMNSGNHPDLYRIDCGEAESIKITQIRELISRLQMRAFEAVTKICIIKDIENLTAESSNALLKTLEEPSQATLMILTTSLPEENLKTVVSRCHVMTFYPSSVAIVRERLMTDDRLDAPCAQFLAQYAQGCIGKARELNEDGFMKQKNDVINNLALSQTNDTYLKKILADKLQTRMALSVLLSWFRDLLVMKVASSSSRTIKKDQIVHFDRYDELLTLEKKYTFVKINGIIEELVRSLELLGENLNIKIPFILLREKIWVR